MIFPVVCPYCGCVIMPDEEACESCMKKLSVSCTVTDIQNSLCVSPFEYDGIFKKAVLNLKFHNKPFYAEAMSVSLCNALKKEFPDEKPEIITFVPAVRKSIRKRGYNQALILAREISRLTGIPVREDVLGRVTDTLPMKNMTPEERQNNLKRAFQSFGNDVSLNSIMLIDDIYTTGATIDACAHALSQKGAERVFFMSLAIGEDAEAGY